MNVNVLTSGYWPSYPHLEAKLPDELTGYQGVFKVTPLAPLCLCSRALPGLPLLSHLSSHTQPCPAVCALLESAAFAQPCVQSHGLVLLGLFGKAFGTLLLSHLYKPHSLGCLGLCVRCKARRGAYRSNHLYSCVISPVPPR